ncbi:hypothetical protein HDU99_007234 [Rhizoclosmatium hyalinum]|nr:hypothetical protein HDU99_007234 [Rhizoclosmatium hyalinum]
MSTSLDSVVPADQELGFVAATIDNKSVSVLSEKVLDYEETIRQLREQIKTLTHERDDMLKYIKSTNEMILNLIKNVENKDGTANTFQVASQLLQLQSSLKKPEELVPTLEKELTPLESQYASESLVRKNTRGHVTVLRDKDKKDTLQMLQKESAQYHPYISILQRFPLFAAFPRHILEKVSLAAYEMTRKKGQLIVTKVFKFRRTATVVAKTDITMIVVTRQKLDDIISTSPEVQKMVDEFSANKEIWWLKQQYASGSEKFGSEFANDIARKNIRRLDLFKDAPDAFIDSLAMTTTCLVIQDSQNIVNIGEESDAMYFLLAGVVQVVGDTGVVHAEITAGSFFGEVGVLLNMKRTASIRAKGECYVFKLTKENLDRVVLDHPVMSEKLHAEAAERLALFKARTQETTDSKTTAPDQFDMEIGENALTKLSLFRGVDQNVIQELAISMFQRTATVIAKTDSTMVVVTKQKLDEIISQNNDVKRVVDSFAADKESWWKKQQYIRSQEKFGAEFAHDIAREDIRKLGIFASAPDAFVDSLATAIKCLVYSSNQNIVSVDEDSDAMYFILDGSVEVVGSTGTVHAEMSGGAFFGEVGVLLNMKRTASIRAKEESHVFKLTKQDLDSVIGNYPSMKHILKTAADERYELFKKRSAQPSAESKDGNKEHVPDQFDMEVAGQSLAKVLDLFI